MCVVWLIGVGWVFVVIDEIVWIVIVCYGFFMLRRFYIILVR